MNEQAIKEFWDAHPCGDLQVGGLDDGYERDFERFFAEYDRLRYTLENHILDRFDAMTLAGKRLLEVGLGEGADAEQLIRRGARWSGVELTRESVERVRARLVLRRLPHDALCQASVVALPFPDEAFDVVFSHGALHHVPDILTAQRELHRVLSPSGELVAMLYARWSLNYLVAIGAIRRAALLASYPFIRFGVIRPNPLVSDHVRNARRIGLRRYLRMKEFIHANTDGPDNPFSGVYDLKRVRRDFPDFEVVRTYRRFMHAPPLPVHGWPGSHLIGWHLWVHLRPRSRAARGSAPSALPSGAGLRRAALPHPNARSRRGLQAPGGHGRTSDRADSRAE